MNKNIENLVEKFHSLPYLANMGAKKIAKKEGMELEDVYEARALYRGKKNKFIEDKCAEAGIDASQVKSFWFKSKDFSINVKNNKDDISSLKDEIIDEMKDYSPIYPELKRNKIKDAHLLVIDPADIHVGD